MERSRIPAGRSDNGFAEEGSGRRPAPFLSAPEPARSGEGTGNQRRRREEAGGSGGREIARLLRRQRADTVGGIPGRRSVGQSHAGGAGRSGRSGTGRGSRKRRGIAG